jgi:hypothetical protein
MGYYIEKGGREPVKCPPQSLPILDVPSGSGFLSFLGSEIIIPFSYIIYDVIIKINF